VGRARYLLKRNLLECREQARGRDPHAQRGKSYAIAAGRIQDRAPAATPNELDLFPDILSRYTSTDLPYGVADRCDDIRNFPHETRSKAPHRWPVMDRPYSRRTMLDGLWA